MRYLAFFSHSMPKLRWDEPSPRDSLLPVYCPANLILTDDACHPGEE